MKHCPKCNQKKSKTEFYKNRLTSDGLASECRSCYAINAKKYAHTKNGLMSGMYYRQGKRMKSLGFGELSYTKEEFKEWLFAQSNFVDIYSSWANNGYKKMECPSVDRIDDNKGYMFDNMQLLTWQQNKDKSNSDRSSGKNNKVSISISRYDLNNNFIDSFHSGRYASRETGIAQASINRCLKGTQNTAGGYIWKYTSLDYEELINNNKAMRKP